MTHHHQRPNDVQIYHDLYKLGKTPDCNCYIDWRFGAGGRQQAALTYRVSCPVHYPQTSQLFGNTQEEK